MGTPPVNRYPCTLSTDPEYKVYPPSTDDPDKGAIPDLRLALMMAVEGAISWEAFQRLEKERGEAIRKEYVAAHPTAGTKTIADAVAAQIEKEAGREPGIDAFSYYVKDQDRPQVDADRKQSLVNTLWYTMNYLAGERATNPFRVVPAVVAFALAGKVGEKELCVITQKGQDTDGKERVLSKAVVLPGRLIKTHSDHIAAMHPLRLDALVLAARSGLVKQVPAAFETTPESEQKVFHRLGDPAPIFFSPQEILHLLLNLLVLGVEQPWRIVRLGKPMEFAPPRPFPADARGMALAPYEALGTWRAVYLNVTELQERQLEALSAMVGGLLSPEKGGAPIPLQKEPNAVRALAIQQAIGGLVPESLPAKRYPLILNETMLSGGRIAIPTVLTAAELVPPKGPEDPRWLRLEEDGAALPLSPNEAFHLLHNMDLLGVVRPWEVLRPAELVPADQAGKDPQIPGGAALPTDAAAWLGTRAIGTWRPYYFNVHALREGDLQQLQALVGKLREAAQETSGQKTFVDTPIEDPAMVNPARVSAIRAAIGPLVAECKPSPAPSIEALVARQDRETQDAIAAGMGAFETVVPDHGPTTDETWYEWIWYAAMPDSIARFEPRAVESIPSSTPLKRVTIMWLTTLLKKEGRAAALWRMPVSGDSANVEVRRDRVSVNAVLSAVGRILSDLAPTSPDRQGLAELFERCNAQLPQLTAEESTGWNLALFVPMAIGGVFTVWQIGVSLMNWAMGSDFSPERLARGTDWPRGKGLSARQRRILERAEKLWTKYRRKPLRMSDTARRNLRLLGLVRNGRFLKKRSWRHFVTLAEHQERIKEELSRAGLDLDIYPNGERAESDEQRRLMSEYHVHNRAEIESNPLNPRAIEIYGTARAAYDAAHSSEIGQMPADVEAWTQAVEAARPASRPKYAAGETPLTKWTEDLVELDRTPGALRRANLQIREHEIVQLANNLAAGQNTGLESLCGGVGKDLLWNGTAHLLRLAREHNEGKTSEEWRGLNQALRVAGLEMVAAKVELYRLKEGTVASGGSGDRGLMAGQVAGILMEIQDGMRDENGEQVRTSDPSQPIRPHAVRRGGLAQLRAEDKMPMLVVSELTTIFSLGAHRGNESGDLKLILGALDDGRFPISGNWTYRDKAEAMMRSAPGIGRFDGIHVDDLDADKAARALEPMRDAAAVGSAKQPAVYVETIALRALADKVALHRGTETWNLRNPVDAKAYELIPVEYRDMLPKDAYGNPIVPSTGLGRPVRQAFENFVKWRIAEQLAGIQVDGGVAELREAKARLLKESDGSPLHITADDVTRYAAYRWRSAAPAGFFTPDLFIRPVEVLARTLVIDPVRAVVAGIRIAVRADAARVGPGEVDFAARARVLRAGQREVAAPRAEGVVPETRGGINPGAHARPQPMFDEGPAISPEIREAVRAEAARVRAAAAKTAGVVRAKAGRIGKGRL